MGRKEIITQCMLRKDMTMKRYLLIIGLIIVSVVFGAETALAQPEPAPAEQASPLHPAFALLDETDKNVLETGAPCVSF
jgi:hypothetical protein